MRKKILLLIMLILSTLLTGCDIKFIEKVELESEESESEYFGEIIIEEPKSTIEEESTEESIVESEEDTTIESITQSEIQTESESESEVEIKGAFDYKGITFIRQDDTPTMYVEEECTAKIDPNSASKDYSSLKRGDFVAVTAISQDERWAMVSIYGGPSVFVRYNYLTTEEIRLEQALGSLSESVETTESVSSEESQNSEQTESSESQNSESQSSEQQSSQQPPEEDNYSGIEFPSNASSTSFNMGVEFADVTVTLSVRKDGAVVSNGPDRAANSTGYYALGTLSKGTSIKCTGIGRNGYCRVDYNGQTGFIDSKYLSY